jgi:hypothetical protein
VAEFEAAVETQRMLHHRCLMMKLLRNAKRRMQQQSEQATPRQPDQQEAGVA